jgi:hypothetical protein
MNSIGRLLVNQKKIGAQGSAAARRWQSRNRKE